jgi:hypothetical protein
MALADQSKAQSLDRAGGRAQRATTSRNKHTKQPHSKNSAQIYVVKPGPCTPLLSCMRAAIPQRQCLRPVLLRQFACKCDMRPIPSFIGVCGPSRPLLLATVGFMVYQNPALETISVPPSPLNVLVSKATCICGIPHPNHPEQPQTISSRCQIGNIC